MCVGLKRCVNSELREKRPPAGQGAVWKGLFAGRVPDRGLNILGDRHGFCPLDVGLIRGCLRLCRVRCEAA